MVRCFIGYLLPEEVKDDIAKLQEEMKKWPMKCKFVERENLHLCFSFLGEIDETKLNEIGKKLDFLSGKFKKIEAEIDGLIAIPNQNYIRVLALKVIENESLKEVYKEVVREIGGDSKPAHITLCRVKSVENKRELKKRIEEVKRDYGKITIEEIQMIKSELRKTGPLYSVIHHSKFS
jgi:2'-5' RNA ligase